MNAFLAIPEAPLREKLHPDIYVEPKDRDPANEDSRQIKLVNRLKRCPHVAVHAVPNGGRQSDWSRIRGEKMGVVAGEPDLGLDWAGGCARIEMKNGEEMPRPNQVARLNQLHAMGKPVAVIRTPDGGMAWLARIGAPIGDGL